MKTIAARSEIQIDLAHHRIIDEVLRRTVKHDPPRLDDLSPIGDGPKPLNSEPLNPEPVNGYKWHMIDSLFEILDVNNDGAISRSDLHIAAKRLGWHWYEAPIFALIDLLTIPGPIRKHQFAAYMQQVRNDPIEKICGRDTG